MTPPPCVTPLPSAFGKRSSLLPPPFSVRVSSHDMLHATGGDKLWEKSPTSFSPKCAPLPISQFLHFIPSLFRRRWFLKYASSPSFPGIFFRGQDARRLDIFEGKSRCERRTEKGRRHFHVPKNPLLLGSSARPLRRRRQSCVA